MNEVVYTSRDATGGIVWQAPFKGWFVAHDTLYAEFKDGAYSRLIRYENLSKETAADLPKPTSRQLALATNIPPELRSEAADLRYFNVRVAAWSIAGTQTINRIILAEDMAEALKVADLVVDEYGSATFPAALLSVEEDPALAEIVEQMRKQARARSHEIVEGKPMVLVN